MMSGKRGRGRLLGVTLLGCVSLSVQAANSVTEEVTRLRIDASSSTVQRVAGSTDTPLGSLLPFGGFVDVVVTRYYVDTLFDGRPREPTAFASLALDFVALDVAPAASDFAPSLRYDVFEYVGDTIGAQRFDACSYARATAMSCTGFVAFSGHPASYAGRFDGTMLQIAGDEARGFNADYYAFAVTAVALPLPPAGLMMLPVLAALAMRRRV